MRVEKSEKQLRGERGYNIEIADNHNKQFPYYTAGILDEIEMSYKFSEPLRQILQEAGWYEGRRADVGEAVQALEKVGFSVFPQAYQVIQEFEGLEAKGERNFTFSIPEVVTYFDTKDIPFINKLIDEVLCPFAYGERVLLFISQSGKVLILHDEWTTYLLYDNLEVGLKAAFFISEGSEFIWILDEAKPVNFR